MQYVSCRNACWLERTLTFVRSLASLKHSLLPRACLPIFLACAAMKPIPRLPGLASYPLVPTRAQYVRRSCHNPQKFAFPDSQHSNSSMADESMQSTSPRRRTYEQTHQLSFARHCDNLRRNPLYSSLAHTRERSWMGRLDYPGILHSTNPFHGHPPDQFVSPILSTPFGHLY